MRVNPYREGLLALKQLQQKLGKPIKQRDWPKIPAMVDKIIKQTDGLAKDCRVQTFRNLAICALRNLEPRYRDWRVL